MIPIPANTPYSINVHYTTPTGQHKVKHFTNASAAKRFYMAQLRKGSNPVIKRAE